jgi:hypothetical protein
LAKYRLLADHFVGGAGGRFLQGGSIVTEGVEVPTGWVPTPYCDPLDMDGVNKFYGAGVKLPGLIRTVWNGLTIQPPVTRWIADPNASPGNPYRQFVLTGLGASLPFAQFGNSGGQAP